MNVSEKNGEAMDIQSSHPESGFVARRKGRYIPRVRAAIIVVLFLGLAVAVGVVAVTARNGRGQRAQATAVLPADAGLAAPTAPILAKPTAPAVYNGVDQVALQSCIAAGAHDCAGTVPGLGACQQARLLCNWYATEDSKKGNPLAGPAPSGVISEQQAIAIARASSKTPSTSAASATAPVYSKLLTYDAWLKAGGGFVSPAIDQSRLVWVITVISPMATDGGPGTPPSIKPAYTMTLDAGTGALIDLCIGCATLGP